jgi:hypothetical protein
MTWFSDIERQEVITICELCLGAGQAELIPDLLRQGATPERCSAPAGRAGQPPGSAGRRRAHAVARPLPQFGI